MSITLDTLPLPDDCLWQNEFDALPMAVATARTLSGRLVVSETALAAGRPIDLGGDDAWIVRSDLLTLHGWASTPGWSGTLRLHDGRAFSVRFRTQEEKAVETAQVRDTADPAGDDRYQLVTLRLETC
ncbi:conserved hypothetical protein [Solidesulfovibrio fructosivorans JJ]]|uniref:Uncharacterized protein n=1 Tax=Solidesulfovibrio fructosivorans JJ] TaxID=596151 RepID=E1JRA9_SOLFR|nr:hypothetical protein [Solidesulfovibrio fructosivorans]EFL53110.1 conserved hypothetical protein [Solidesulfovibrio fructosivorans JJ]]